MASERNRQLARNEQCGRVRDGILEGRNTRVPPLVALHHSLTSIIFQLSVTVRGPEVFQCH